MSPRIRKLVGGVGMLMFVFIYALLAMALADSRPMQQAPDALRVVLYMVLGIAWVAPLMPLIVWMEYGHFRRRG